MKKRQRKILLVGAGLLCVLVATLLVVNRLTIVNNPTAADVTYTKLWEDSSGSVIANFSTATISGTVTCEITATPTAIAETDTWSKTYTGPTDPGTPVYGPCPFYLGSIVLNVYQKSGSGYSSTPYKVYAAAVQTASYASQIQAWAINWFQHSGTSSYADPGEPPFPSSKWLITWDTHLVPNGEYKCEVKAIWEDPPVTSAGTRLMLGSPPSLDSSNGVKVLSVFYTSFSGGTGTNTPGEGFPDVLPFIAVAAIVGLAVIYFARRKRVAR
jgi:hypothetical protein